MTALGERKYGPAVEAVRAELAKAERTVEEAQSRLDKATAAFLAIQAALWAAEEAEDKAAARELAEMAAYVFAEPDADHGPRGGADG